MSTSPASLNLRVSGCWFQSLWKIWLRQLGWLFPIYGKIISCSKPPTRFVWCMMYGMLKMRPPRSPLNIGIDHLRMLGFCNFSESLCHVMEMSQVRAEWNKPLLADDYLRLYWPKSKKSTSVYTLINSLVGLFTVLLRLRLLLNWQNCWNFESCSCSAKSARQNGFLSWWNKPARITIAIFHGMDSLCHRIF